MNAAGILSTAQPVRVSPEWLVLREPADAAARSVELADRLERHLPPTGRLVIHDLGGGSGAMGRWLAPLLSGPQHWVVHDRDADLLELAVADVPGAAADGSAVTVEARLSDITRPAPGHLAGASLVTASALLDMLTADELRRMLDACAGTGCPIVIALSVVGRVALTPAEPLDAHMAAAFNAHQRRMTPAGRLLGPDAVAAAVAQLRGMGAGVLVRPSPWHLEAAHADLTAEWFDGWVGAACEQEPALAAPAAAYRDRRLAQVVAGELAVTVAHADLLVLP
jgi:predicted RNA methylase